MKVLIAGASWHDNLLSVLKRGFESVGHTVVLFDDNCASTIDLTLGKIFSRTPFKKTANSFNEKHRTSVTQALVQMSKEERPDLLFVINGQKYPAEFIKSIRSILDIPAAAYIIDDPLLGKDWLYDLSGYSHLFVIDDSWMGYLEYFVPGGVYFLPQVGDSSVFCPLEVEKTHDIGFGGTLSLRLPNAPSGHLRSQILNSLAEKGYSIKAFVPGVGEATDKYPALKNCDCVDGYQSHEELNKLYNTSRIVVSIHSPQFKNGISPRVFEAAYAGAFQLVEWKPDVDKLFKGKMQSFRSLEELFSKVDYYLRNPGEAAQIAKECMEIANKDHTAKQRVEKIINTIKKK